MLNAKYKIIRSLGLSFLIIAVGLSASAQTFKVLHAFGNAGDGAPRCGGRCLTAKETSMG